MLVLIDAVLAAYCGPLRHPCGQIDTGFNAPAPTCQAGVFLRSPSPLIALPSTVLYTKNLEQNAEKNVSTQSPAAREDARLPYPHENRRRTGGFVSPARSGTQEAHRQFRKVIESQVFRKVFGSYAPKTSGECMTTVPVMRARTSPLSTCACLNPKPDPRSDSRLQRGWAARWREIASKGVSARQSACGSIN